MKHLLLLLFLIINGKGFAQDPCEGYFPNAKGMQLEYRLSNGKGKTLLNRQQTVLALTPNTDGLDVTTIIQNTDKNNNAKAGSILVYHCKNGQVATELGHLLNAQGLESNLGLEVIGEGLLIPNNLQVGQKLPNSDNTIKFSRGKSILTSMQYLIRDFQVEAQETLNTPAGDFDCIQLSFWVDTKNYAPSSIGLKYNTVFTSIRMVQWYAKKIGLIKEEVYKKKGNLFSRTELIKLTR